MKRGPRAPKKRAPANQRRAPPSLRPPLAGRRLPGRGLRTRPRAAPRARPPPPGGPCCRRPPPEDPRPRRAAAPLSPGARGPPTLRALLPVTNLQPRPLPRSLGRAPSGRSVSSPGDPSPSTLSDPAPLPLSVATVVQLPPQAVPAPKRGLWRDRGQGVGEQLRGRSSEGRELQGRRGHLGLGRLEPLDPVDVAWLGLRGGGGGGGAPFPGVAFADRRAELPGARPCRPGLAPAPARRRRLGAGGGIFFLGGGVGGP
ncbi:basic proline-rich protein-like [Ovis aries]|uniref:basic proline-rich protein-like n=1 Tax=Ovis aries TaxID=9940 RepID=UPI002952804A|nr:basic proline-rich protein-like [Ovis aries]XP_060258950.1 basic proline-rich protein-like [Ovis aries]XP_060258951.1 basic proline-rich protein-like [Ovis aries]